MNQNAEILSVLIDEDFGLKSKGTQRYSKSIDHSSLVLDKERGIFYFNAEGIVGDALVYLTKVRNYSFESARDYLRNFNYSGTHIYNVQANGEDVVVFPELVDIFYDLGKTKREYFYERGLNDSTIDSFRLGWYNGFNTVPFIDGGVFRNFQMRKDNPKTIRKYYKGIGPQMFNADILKLVDTVYVTEGPVDAMAMVQHGLPAISTDMSGNVLPQWYSKFIGQKTVFICFDNDDAGEKEAKRVAKILGITRCRIYTFSETEIKSYDPCDYFVDGGDKDDLVDRIKKHSKFAFEL